MPGGAQIALHSGPSSPRRNGSTIVFYASDAPALQANPVARGAKPGKIRQGGVFCCCDGNDPGGNPIQFRDR